MEKDEFKKRTENYNWQSFWHFQATECLVPGMKHRLLYEVFFSKWKTGEGNVDWKNPAGSFAENLKIDKSFCKPNFPRFSAYNFAMEETR